MADRHAPDLLNAVFFVIWLVAGVAAFLPFASDTSPWNALMLNVPGNQGNWWHVLIGAPFFLALPMMWLRVRSFSVKSTFTSIERRVIWIVVGLSVLGTMLVETPFLLHRSGTSEAQRLSIIGLGLGLIVASAVLLLRRGHAMPPIRACLAGLNTAYLANASLCLIVYGRAAGEVRPQAGWMVTMVIVWPMLLELVWIFAVLPAPNLRQEESGSSADTRPPRLPT
jgi:hypothetical protein